MAKFHLGDGSVIECLDRDAPKKARILCVYHGARVTADEETLRAIQANIEVPLVVYKEPATVPVRPAPPEGGARLPKR